MPKFRFYNNTQEMEKSLGMILLPLAGGAASGPGRGTLPPQHRSLFLVWSLLPDLQQGDAQSMLALCVDAAARSPAGGLLIHAGHLWAGVVSR